MMLHNSARWVNMILYPVLTILSWLIVVGEIPWGMPRLVAAGLGVVTPALFLWIYVPMFREKGWNVFREMVETRQE